jgi:hypothetical protein
MLPELEPFSIKQGRLTYKTYFYKTEKKSGWIIRQYCPWIESPQTFYDEEFRLRIWDTEIEAIEWLKGYLYGEEYAEGQTLQEGRPQNKSKRATQTI